MSRKIFGAHEHRHDRAKIFYARIIALPYETKNVRLVWKGDVARIKYFGAVMSMLMPVRMDVRSYAQKDLSCR